MLAIQFVVLMLLPTLLVGTALHGPRGVRAVRRLVKSADVTPEPNRPPIERLASDLRRLLQRYETIRRSPQMAKRAQHLLAVEAAIADCATEAADALGVHRPVRLGRARLATPELRALLSALAADGLVLRPATGLFEADGSF